MANQLETTILLSDIERIQIYINSPRKTVAAIKKATGADYILNGTLYDMATGKVNCHLKADGKVIAKPDYTVYGYAWDNGLDFAMTILPEAAKRNYIACTPLIINGVKKDKPVYDEGQGGSRGRSAIGTIGDKLVLFCTKDGTSADRTPEKLRDVLYAAGWDTAVMLDGGGSSQCDFDGQKITSSRKVQHLILVYLKKDETCPYKEPTNTIKRGSRGEGAKWVQWQLNRYGAKLTVDGKFGSKSESALKAFQMTVFSDPDEWDSKCGSKTRKELRK